MRMHAHSTLTQALVWKVGKFVGEQEHTLRAEVTLVATTKERKPWARPPISMSFQVCVCVCPEAVGCCSIDYVVCV